MSLSEASIRSFSSIRDSNILTNKENDIEDSKEISPVLNLHDKFQESLNDSPLHLSDSEAEDDGLPVSEGVEDPTMSNSPSFSENISQEINSSKLPNAADIDISNVPKEDRNVSEKLEYINKSNSEETNDISDECKSLNESSQQSSAIEKSDTDSLNTCEANDSKFIKISEINTLCNGNDDISDDSAKSKNSTSGKLENIDKDILSRDQSDISEKLLNNESDNIALTDIVPSEDQNSSDKKNDDLEKTILISEFNFQNEHIDHKEQVESSGESQEKILSSIDRGDERLNYLIHDKILSTSELKDDIILLKPDDHVVNIDENLCKDVQVSTNDIKDDSENKSEVTNNRQSKRIGDDNISAVDSSLTKRMKLDETINLEDDGDMAIDTNPDENEKSGRLSRRQKRIQQVFKTYNMMRDALIGMSRTDVEWFVAGKIVDALDAGSELARSREQIETLQRRVAKLESQLSVVSKHVSDLDFLHNKCISSINMGRMKNGQILAHPHYVTRSVGLQVCITGTAMVQYNSSKRSSKNDSPGDSSNQQVRSSNISHKQIKQSNQHQQNDGVSTSNKKQLNLPNSNSSATSTADTPPMPVKLIRNLSAVTAAANNTRGDLTIVDLTEEEEEQDNNIASKKTDGRKTTIAKLNGNCVKQWLGSNSSVIGNNAGTFVTAKRLPPLPSSQYTSPVTAQQQRRTLRPSRPLVTISQVTQGIVISWTMPDESIDHAKIVSYQIYAYQEGDTSSNSNTVLTSDLWRKVGDVKAMALPMACTLTQFTLGNRYHFAVRAVDVQGRVGHFSIPKTIQLNEIIQ